VNPKIIPFYNNSLFFYKIAATRRRTTGVYIETLNHPNLIINSTIKKARIFRKSQGAFMQG
jgi:hypothetical protein